MPSIPEGRVGSEDTWEAPAGPGAETQVELCRVGSHSGQLGLGNLMAVMR